MYSRLDQKFFSRCKQIVLVVGIVLMFVNFYLIDQNILNIADFNRKITQLQQGKPSSFTCSQICEKPFTNSFDDVCCPQQQKSEKCLQKQYCQKIKISKLKDNMDTANTSMIIEIIAQVVILIFLIAFCLLTRKKYNRSIESQNRLILNETIVSKKSTLIQNSLNSVQKVQSCTICLQLFRNDKTIKLKCNHIFHAKCIRQWLVTKVTCPICRVYI